MTVRVLLLSDRFLELGRLSNFLTELPDINLVTVYAFSELAVERALEEQPLVVVTYVHVSAKAVFMKQVLSYLKVEGYRNPIPLIFISSKMVQERDMDYVIEACGMRDCEFLEPTQEAQIKGVVMHYATKVIE
jgi:hypothetical protein